MKNIFTKVVSILSYKEKLNYILLIFLSIILMFLESFGIAIFIPYLNIIINGDFKIEIINHILNDINKDKLILISSIFLIFFFIIKNLYIIIFNYLMLRYQVKLNKKLVSDLLYKYFYMPYKNYFERNSSTMIRDITSGCSDFSNLVLMSISMINEIFIILGVTGLIIFLEGFSIFLLLFIFLNLCAFFYLVFKKKFKSWGKKRYFFSAELLKNLIQSFSSPKEIRILGKQNYFMEICNYANQKIIHYNFLKNMISTLPKNIFEILGIIIIIIFLLNEIAISNYDDAIISLSILVISFAKILPSISRLVIQMASLKNGQKTINTVHHEFGIEIEKVKNNLSELKFEKNIQFKDLNFSFDKTKVFKNFNLEIKKGEKIFIYGKSGSGKSTLINLLTGLIMPDKGEVLIDNKKIYSNLKSLRKKIGYVPQEFILLDDSIKKNIAFGFKDEDISTQKLSSAINRASLKEYIDSLPKKEEQNIGEKGITISGGQRQRVAIARALYLEPEILILDEATSAIDSLTEVKIIKEIVKQKSSNLTLIVVSHNLNLKKFFDTSIELKKIT